MTSIAEVYRRWPTHDDCIRHLEAVRWPDGPLCPYCGADKVARHREQGRRDRWQCQICHTSFAVTVGTVFHQSHVDLQRWFLLIYLTQDGTPPRSTAEIQRALNMRRQTMSSMTRRITGARHSHHPWFETITRAVAALATADGS